MIRDTLTVGHLKRPCDSDGKEREREERTWCFRRMQDMSSSMGSRAEDARQIEKGVENLHDTILVRIISGQHIR